MYVACEVKKVKLGQFEILNSITLQKIGKVYQVWNNSAGRLKSKWSLAEDEYSI